MARLIRSDVVQTIACNIATVFEDGSQTTKSLVIGDVVEGLRYVKDHATCTVSGKVTDMTFSGTKVSAVSTSNPVDYFGKDVSITNITIDASEKYASNIVGVNPREIVEDEGVENVKRMLISLTPSVKFTMLYSNNQTIEHVVEVGSVLKDAVIIGSNGNVYEGTYVVKAFAYTLKNHEPIIGGLYLVPFEGGAGFKTAFDKILEFADGTTAVVDNPESLAGIREAMDASEDKEVFATLGCDVTIPKRPDGKITTLMVREGETLHVDLAGHNITTEAYAFYVNGGTMTISDNTGNGAIIGTHAGDAFPMVFVNAGGVCTMEGGLIDTTQVDTSETYNWLYGAVCSGDGVFNMTGGKMKIQSAAGMSITNGTASGEGAKFFIGGDAVIDGCDSVAIYLADNKSITVTDNAKIYGGILTRMGDVTISGNAYVEGSYNGADHVGYLSVASGCDACAAAVTEMLGVYGSALGNDATVTVKDNAKLKSNAGAAVVMALVNTKFDQKADVSIEKSVNAKGDDGVWNVINHDTLVTMAAAEGKNLGPETNSTDLKVTVDGKVVYPALTGTEG